MPITVLPRTEALKRHPYLAHAVLSFQAEIHPTNQGLYEAGQSVWLDNDAEDATIITQAQADELNREDNEWHERISDDLPLPNGIGNPPGFNIAAAISGNIQGVLTRNGMGWVKLCQAMGWGDTIVIPVTVGPYLGQNNNHPPMKRARDRLLAAGIGERNSEAISAPPPDAARLIPDLFRIARYNASAPYIYMTAIGSKTVVALCQYLNFHFDGYDEAETDRMIAALPDAGLTHFSDGICREPISSTGKLTGRRIDQS